MLRLIGGVDHAPVETGPIERWFGIFGFGWAIFSIGSVGNLVYTLCTIPLGLLAIPQIRAAYKPQLLPRTVIAALTMAAWLTVTMVAFLSSADFLDALRGLWIYIAITALSAYNYVQLLGRLAHQQTSAAARPKTAIKEIRIT